MSSPTKPPPASPQAAPPSHATPPPPSSPAPATDLTIIKDGILFKKRDHFNEYPPRYFVLNSNSTLLYYRNYNEQPIRSIAIDKNIVISFDEKPIQYNHHSLFLFYISSKTISSSSSSSSSSSVHSSSSSVIYILGTKIESERKLWITELESLINKSKNLMTPKRLLKQDSNEYSSPSQSDSTAFKDQDNTKQSTPSPSSASSLISTIVSPENPEATYANLSEKLKQKIDSVAYAILTLSNELPLPAVTADSTLPKSTSNLKSEWNLIYEKNNILGYRKSGSGVVCVRGETILPYTIPEICSLTNQWTNEIEPNLDTYQRLTWLSKHTGVEHVKYKAVWPTAPRDFVNMTHWRVLKHDPNRILHPNSSEKDSTYLLNFSFSEQSVEEKYCPPLDGYVRGNVLVGYVMKHIPGGTRVIFIIQVVSSRIDCCLISSFPSQCDLGGSVPISVTNFIARSKPLVLVAIRKALDKRYRYRERPNILSLPRVSYQDVNQVVEHNYQLFLQTHGMDQSQEFQQQPLDQAIEDEKLNIQHDSPDESTSLSSISLNNENLLPLTASTLEGLPSSSDPKHESGFGESSLVAPGNDGTLEMVIYKKRDHLNTWVLRYLTCDGEYLNYYEDIDEVFPKKSLFIDENLKIQVDILPVVIDNQKRFTFTITHPEMKIQYILACNTLEDSLQWSNLIQNIQRKSQKSQKFQPEKMSPSREIEQNTKQQAPPSEEEDGKNLPPSHPSLRQISDEIQSYELNYSPRSQSASSSTFGQLSLTRLVITSLPLYYLTILWRGSSDLQSVVKLILFFFILSWAYMEWNLNRMIGPSIEKNPNLIAPGRHLYRLSINIEHFKKHITSHSIQGCTDTVTTSQVMIKILANLISATPSLNGYLLFQKFYPSLKSSVDLSVYHESPTPSPSYFYKLPSLTSQSKLSTIQALQQSHEYRSSSRLPLISLFFDYLSVLFQVYLNISISSLYHYLHGVLPYGIAMIYIPSETMDTGSIYYPQDIFSNSSFYSPPLIISVNEISLESSSQAIPTHLPSLTTPPLGPAAPMSPKSSLSGRNNGGQKSVRWENAHDIITLNIWIDNLAMSATESTEFIQKLQEYFQY